MIQELRQLRHSIFFASKGLLIRYIQMSCTTHNLKRLCKGLMGWPVKIDVKYWKMKPAFSVRFGMESAIQNFFAADRECIGILCHLAEYSFSACPSAVEALPNEAEEVECYSTYIYVRGTYASMYAQGPNC